MAADRRLWSLLIQGGFCLSIWSARNGNLFGKWVDERDNNNAGTEGMERGNFVTGRAARQEKSKDVSSQVMYGCVKAIVGFGMRHITGLVGRSREKDLGISGRD